MFFSLKNNQPNEMPTEKAHAEIRCPSTGEPTGRRT